MKPTGYREGPQVTWENRLPTPIFYSFKANYNHTCATFTQQASALEYFKASQKSTKVTQMSEAITEIKQL